MQKERKKKSHGWQDGTFFSRPLSSFLFFSRPCRRPTKPRRISPWDMRPCAKVTALPAEGAASSGLQQWEQKSFHVCCAVAGLVVQTNRLRGVGWSSGIHGLEAMAVHGTRASAKPRADDESLSNSTPSDWSAQQSMGTIGHWAAQSSFSKLPGSFVWSQARSRAVV